MNTLFIIDNNVIQRNEIINARLNDARVLLITKQSIYETREHCIEARLQPQEKLIDDISNLVLNDKSSMVFDMWDETFNKSKGQDVESLVLSLLGSFVNNIQSPRTLIIDSYNELMPSVQKRVLDIVKLSKKYNLDTLIAIDNVATTELEFLVMNSHVVYIPKNAIETNKTVQSILTLQEHNDIENLEENATYVKRLK